MKKPPPLPRRECPQCSVKIMVTKPNIDYELRCPSCGRQLEWDSNRKQFRTGY